MSASAAYSNAHTNSRPRGLQHRAQEFYAPALPGRQELGAVGREDHGKGTV